MKLSDLTIDSIKEFISGDVGYTPSLNGRKILKLFNQVGFKDIYKPNDGGMPGGLSRNAYILECLMKINGTKEMQRLIEIVFSKEHFETNEIGKNLEEAVAAFNKEIQQDGFKLESINDQYNVIGAIIPDEVEVEVHFEQIQQQIIEQIRNAQFLIWVAVAWFTDKEIMNELYKKYKQGVNIQIIIIDDEINAKVDPPLDKFFSVIKVKPIGKYENLMHNKFCIIDLKTVIHGSYNWTIKAQYNKETMTIDKSRDLAEKFALQFMNLKRG